MNTKEAIKWLNNFKVCLDNEVYCDDNKKLNLEELRQIIGLLKRGDNQESITKSLKTIAECMLKSNKMAKEALDKSNKLYGASMAMKEEIKGS